ncbi:MAG TPA: hypothetical protein PLE60_15290 [Candidatus Latescibacteria bacterium]|nr:hypothetical protein [Candidatus Latescibacterota bacterium]
MARPRKQTGRVVRQIGFTCTPEERRVLESMAAVYTPNDNMSEMLRLLIHEGAEKRGIVINTMARPEPAKG